MKQRFAYLIVYALPGTGLAAAVAAAVALGVSSIFWIFVFGDNAWPTWSDYIINGAAITGFIIALVFIARYGYIVGKRREDANKSTNKKHLLYSFLIFIGAVALFGIYQRGYIFNPPASTVCRTMCTEKGYDGAITGVSPTDNPPVICSCWNSNTNQHDKIGEVK